MIPRPHPADISLVTSPPAQPARELRPVPDRDPPDPEARDRAPKRMTKRCRRCGKPVPTAAALAWRARRVAVEVDLAAADVFQVRVEASGDSDREALLKRAQARQHEAAEAARLLVADLRRLHAHDRRCRPATAGS